MGTQQMLPAYTAHLNSCTSVSVDRCVFQRSIVRTQACSSMSPWGERAHLTSTRLPTRMSGRSLQILRRALPQMRSSSLMRAPKNRGVFIVFEGVDRCGKSTQSRLLLDHLKGSGVSLDL